MFPLVFFFLHRFSDSFFLENFFFLVFFSLFFRCFLHNPSPPFIMEFSGLPGEPLVPLFCSFANRACPVPIVSISPFFVFSHSFLLSVLILLKASGWLSSLGRAEVCPSRHPHFWRLPLFPFLSYLGGILLCHFWKPFVIILLPCPGSPRPFLSVPWEVARVLLLFLVFFFCLLSIDLSSLPFSLCLKGSVLIDGSWGSLLLIFCRGPLFWMLLFSGLQDPLGLSFIPSWVSRIYYFGLSLNFPFGLDLFFFGLISLWPFFRPQNVSTLNTKK